MKGNTLFVSFLFLALIFAPSAEAHAFGSTYRFPIPVTWYLFASGFVLLLSFLMLSIGTKTLKKVHFPEIVIRNRLPMWVYTFLSTFAFIIFLLAILTGLFGEQVSAFNFNMTYFWIVWVIGFTYLSALFGNIWEIVNPWKAILMEYERITKKQLLGIYTLPESFGYYPALLFYFLFIVIELLIGTTPFSLSVFLLQYTVITFFGCLLFGKEVWFMRCEFFSVFFRFISYGASICISKKSVVFRIPTVGLLKERVTHLSAVVFILFMLSSTAFDGFRETNIWYSWYWDFLRSINGSLFWEEYGYRIYELLGLALSPLLFLFLYLTAMFFIKVITNTKQSIRNLSFLFAFTLIPIVFAYHMAHYLTLFVLQGQVLIRLLSDPFGYGWNIFGTAQFERLITTIPASVVWHFQLFIILVGHVISVFLGHIVAIRLFPLSKRAIYSQVPLLILMVCFTVIGLWILAQPLGGSL